MGGGRERGPGQEGFPLVLLSQNQTSVVVVVVVAVAVVVVERKCRHVGASNNFEKRATTIQFKFFLSISSFPYLASLRIDLS